ncbi:unnamed protein product [Spirodela intermedia]|uniref:Uncharacterized protein n=1 Tax=Spirodela intermedia TaxID=51605 RepID=A0A7I8JUZ0_SPIIN|nr:unnamed protein product [Spirodela intermedia]CAA6673575.1 unnamed protein product [Spirodela intermedia]
MQVYGKCINEKNLT